MSDCLTLYLLDYKACIAGAESTEIPDTNMMSGAYKHIFSLHAIGPEHFSAPHVNYASNQLYYVHVASSWKCTVAAAGNLSL